MRTAAHSSVDGVSRRMDVSSLGLQGSTNCPNDPVLSSWPPPPPPPPRPCTAGPDSRRGCPALEWYWHNQARQCLSVHLGKRSVEARILGSKCPVGCCERCMAKAAPPCGRPALSSSAQPGAIMAW